MGKGDRAVRPPTQALTVHLSIHLSSRSPGGSSSLEGPRLQETNWRKWKQRQLSALKSEPPPQFHSLEGSQPPFFTGSFTVHSLEGPWPLSLVQTCR